MYKSQGVQKYQTVKVSAILCTELVLGTNIKLMWPNYKNRNENDDTSKKWYCRNWILQLPHGDEENAFSLTLSLVSLARSMLSIVNAVNGIVRRGSYWNWLRSSNMLCNLKEIILYWRLAGRKFEVFFFHLSWAHF